MKFLDKLTKNSKIFQRHIGISPSLIQELSKKAEPYWDQEDLKSKISKLYIMILIKKSMVKSFLLMIKNIISNLVR